MFGVFVLGFVLGLFVQKWETDRMEVKKARELEEARRLYSNK